MNEAIYLQMYINCIICGWNSFENIDWEPFKSTVSTYLGSRSLNHLSVDDLASHVSSALLTAGENVLVGKQR